jgi:rod shape-determining protein MreD
MIEVTLKYLFRFIVLVLVQIFIFNNIEISGYINPYIYILFLILLPFGTAPGLVVLLGFAMGLSIDIFSETLGMHTAATTFVAFSRTSVLKFFAPHDGYGKGTLPTVGQYGLPWFIKYTTILVLMHHFLLFYIEMFQIQDFFFTLFRVIMSSAFSIATIVLSQYFVFRK